MTAIKTYERFKKYFDKNNIRYTSDDEEYEIISNITLNSRLKSCVLRIACNEGNATIYAHIEQKASEQSRASVMEFLTRVNFRMVMGGFDMDLDAGDIRLKSSLNCMGRASISDEIIGITLFGPRAMLNYYGDYLLDVMSEAKTPKDALNEFFGSLNICSCGCDD